MVGLTELGGWSALQQERVRDELRGWVEARLVSALIADVSDTTFPPALVHWAAAFFTRASCLGVSCLVVGRAQARLWKDPLWRAAVGESALVDACTVGAAGHVRYRLHMVHGRPPCRQRLCKGRGRCDWGGQARRRTRASGRLGAAFVAKWACSLGDGARDRMIHTKWTLFKAQA